MKMNKIIKLVLSVMMMFSLVACGAPTKVEEIEDVVEQTKYTEDDYQDMIDEYVPDGLTNFALEIGDVHGPQARLWLQDKKGTTYSSDESVVTVSDGGKVTAVGEGSAYVVITSTEDEGGLYQVYYYDVYAKPAEADLSNLPVIDGIDFANEIANFNPTGLNTFDLFVGDKHTPGASIYTQVGGTCYSSDESVVEINDSGIVTAVGKGTAYVIIKAPSGGMFQIVKYLVR